MANINANVTLTLDELDALRKQVEKANSERDEAVNEIKKLEDERLQVKITIRKQVLVPTTERFVDRVENPDHVTSRMDRLGRSLATSNYDPFRYDPFDPRPYVDKISYREVLKEHNVEKIEYVHLDEVKRNMFESAKQEVADQITKLNNDLTVVLAQKTNVESQAFRDKVDVETNHNKKTLELTDKYEKQITDVTDSYEKKVKELSDEIKTMKGDEVEKTKDNLIKDLQKKIKELENQSLIKKIFG